MRKVSCFGILVWVVIIIGLVTIAFNQDQYVWDPNAYKQFILLAAGL